MPIHLLRWKDVKVKSVRGTEIQSPLPDLLQTLYRGRLVSEILAMKKQKPISFQKAVILVSAMCVECIREQNFNLSAWYSYHFVEWLSTQGYHIELTGDEFEAQAPQETLS